MKPFTFIDSDQPIKNPALDPSGSNCSWACDAYVIDSNCRALSKPLLIVSFGIDSLYVTSFGSTDDKDAVSTTGSGCLFPSFTVKTIFTSRLRQSENHSTFQLTFSGPIIRVSFSHTHFLVIMFVFLLWLHLLYRQAIRYFLNGLEQWIW